MSNGTRCVHPHMLDTFAHWNFVLDLYCKELQNIPRIALLKNQITELSSSDGTYDTALSYQRYQNGGVVVFPMHLRGMDRKDFTVLEEPAFETERALHVFTHTLHKKIALETKWQVGSFDKTEIMSIPIGKQRTSSCASMSIKYACVSRGFVLR